MRDKNSVWTSQLERTNERKERCVDLSVGDDERQRRTLFGSLRWRETNERAKERAERFGRS